jgi:hypothetical protein
MMRQQIKDILSLALRSEVADDCLQRNYIIRSIGSSRSSNTCGISNPAERQMRFTDITAGQMLCVDMFNVYQSSID